MFKLTKGEEEKPEEPLFNISINLRNWQGPFKDINYFLIVEKTVSQFSLYHGKESHVCKDGRVSLGHIEGLHTFVGDIDFPEADHLHYGRNISEFEFRNNNLFLTNIGKNPIYTIEGLYSTLSNNKINTKLKALSDVLKLSTPSQYKTFSESISTRKETRLKLLENIYRKNISNQ
jgi:hypothetical protein